MEKARPLTSIGRIVARQLNLLFKKTFPELDDPQAMIQHEFRQDYDYLCPTAIKVYNMKKDKKSGKSLGCGSASELAEKVCSTLAERRVIQELKANEKGFIQVTLAAQLLEHQVNLMLSDDLRVEPTSGKVETVVVDFSSPNIAKEMHVGHLRSTIIGESVCRILEFLGHDVRRVNHLGDWGTQFGMLIAHMKSEHPQFLSKMPEIKDLDQFYKQAKQRFDKDELFKKESQETVVRLQALDPDCIKAWQAICEVSRAEFNRIYQRLKIKNNEFGESYYNPMIPSLLKELTEKKLLEESDGAQCIFIEKQPLPLIVVKKDGGFNYDTTDMAAVRHRLLDIKADRCIYITDMGQLQHFTLIFLGAKKAGWLTHQRLDHMGFGLVLGEDGKKFSSRKAGGSVKLMDLLNEAKEKALEQLKSREKEASEAKEGEEHVRGTNLEPQEYEEAAEKLGMAAIKYYDLKQNRITNYEFSYKKMLDPKGNTAVYLVYAFVRMCSILRKAGLSEADLAACRREGYKVTHPDERKLAAILVKFADIVNESVDDLAINRLTDYIYELSVKVQENYKKYRINGDPNMKTRILLCDAVRKVLDKSFAMVGIEPLQRL